jgi:hypothetical protein
MKTIKTPQDNLQARLFDDEALAWWATQLSPNALNRLETGWQGIFRRSILQLMPAEHLAQHFSEEIGRPTKELYSMAGLMLIAEFKNYTGEQAAEAYTFDAAVQFALNLPRDRQYLSPRSVDNYRKLFREDELAQEVFMDVSVALVEELELDVKRQRLDSTHVHSHMAQLGRQQLLAVGVRRFLEQLRQKQPALYEGLEDCLRDRYAPAETRLFGMGTAKAEEKKTAIGQIGQDMRSLIESFAEEQEVSAMKSYQDMKRLFIEHFEQPEDKEPKRRKAKAKSAQGDPSKDQASKVEASAVEASPSEPRAQEPKLRPRSTDAQGGSTRTLQNPSDSGAGYSGHKGPGYQAQLAQTLPPRDENGKAEGPGLITVVIAQSASVRDSEALPEVLEQQQRSGLMPEEMTADTIYGSDVNVQLCAENGVELISPVGGAAPGKEQPKHNCTRQERERKARLAQRRTDQESEEWQERYAKRCGIEGLNRALDVVTGFKQLRVRGHAAVTMALNLKAAGWNILAAARIKARRARRKALRAAQEQLLRTLRLVTAFLTMRRSNVALQFGPI